MRLGIMGGTFDPIHYGHLFIAEVARVHFCLDSVQFIPNGSPPHKPDHALTAPDHRYAMTQIATRDNPAFVCSAIELNRRGASYTVDTLDIVQSANPGADLYTITGIDAVAEILTWKRHELVMQKTTFIAAARPGFDLGLLEQRLPAAYLKKILIVDSTALGISSTDIRRRVRQGLPIRYLTADGVIDYIAEHRLFSGEEADSTGAPQ